MDNDVILRQFDDIEEKVEFLIELCRSLETSNSELQAKIERLEQELREKQRCEEKFAEEKDLIRSKVDGLLSKLNSFSELT